MSVEEKRQQLETSIDELQPASTMDAVDWTKLALNSSSNDDARNRVFAFSAARNKSTYKKVEEAISIVGTREKGASIIAIMNWILISEISSTDNYATLDPGKLKVNVKRAVLKGVKEGMLIRAKGSKKALGVSGSFSFPMQKIKLKSFKLEGKKYVFPILQPMGKITREEEEIVEEKEDGIKRGTSTAIKDEMKTPKKRPKSRSKRVISNVSV